MKATAVKTYICTLSLGMFQMQEHENGNFVYKSDYDKLKRQNELLLKENKSLVKAGDEIANVVNEYRSTKYGNSIDKIGGFVSWIKWREAKSRAIDNLAYSPDEQ